MGIGGPVGDFVVRHSGIIDWLSHYCEVSLLSQLTSICPQLGLSLLQPHSSLCLCSLSLEPLLPSTEHMVPDILRLRLLGRRD